MLNHCCCCYFFSKIHFDLFMCTRSLEKSMYNKNIFYQTSVEGYRLCSSNHNKTSLTEPHLSCEISTQEASVLKQ